MQELSDKYFGIIKEYLIGIKPRIRLGKDDDLRRFLNGVLWICYSGSQLRELPEKYGHWNTVYKRYADWGRLQIWQGFLNHLTELDSDLEYVMVDLAAQPFGSLWLAPMPVVLRVKKDTQDAEGLGRSKGGFTSKIHMISDALGMPLAFCITAGQRADCTQSIGLLEQFKYDYALMDKAYDSNAILQAIEATGSVAVIPAKHNANTTQT